MVRLPAVFTAVACLVLLGCSSGDSSLPVAQEDLTVLDDGDDFLIGRPLERAGIGDVELAFARYEGTRGDMIETFRAQPWFQDGLTRDEALFVERSLSFVGSYSGPRTAYVSRETIEEKLYLYEKVQTAGGEVELLLIFEPGQDGASEISSLRLMLPALESIVGVPYPLAVMTIVNGEFRINDYNDGQFIRIARCCTLSPFILAHELAHTYWSIGPAWFNEGMADLYAVMTIERLNQDAAPEWMQISADLDLFYEGRKLAASRFPDLLLPRRFASDGLYEAADVFLYEIRDLIGDSEFLLAARQIYLRSDFGRSILSDFRIEDTFLTFSDGAVSDQLMQMFNRQIWGDDGEHYLSLKELESS